MTQYRAWVVNKTETGISFEKAQRTAEQPASGEVLVKIQYSGVNYKDGLAIRADGNIVRQYPLVPGVEFAGTVAASNDSRFREGDAVLATGYEIGVSHDGGYAEYVTVPGDWLVRRPEGLTAKEAMVFGTAGFTAALAILRLQDNGVTPASGPLLVTGATGGVGSLSVAILHKLGYEVWASTGKDAEHDYLKRLGAAKVISRADVQPAEFRPLGRQLWAGAVDSVGGSTLAYVLSAVKYGGSVAACGLTGGAKLPTTVFPFILRGVNLLGIDSVYCPRDVRERIWQLLASDWKPEQLLTDIAVESGFDELPRVLSDIHQALVRGRTVVSIG